VNIVWDETGAPDTATKETLSRAGDAVLRRASVAGDTVEVSLSFTDAGAMRELNARYRGVDRVTDVLSFPQYESSDAFKDAIERFAGMRMSLGDIVICPERALAQASEYGHSPERETAYLFVHGLLHLLGCDHEDEDAKRRMRTEEEAAMAAVSLSPRR
jgi:probable rRNA maturation factor